nr:amino acid permease 3 [Tanacetum cinerariifolium]
MGQETTTGKLEIAAFALEAPSKIFDDDGRPKRTGTVWTASAHIITAVIGSGVLSLAWATAQLGWIAGPTMLLLFSFVTYYTSCLLATCYRCGDPVTGKRNYTYMEAVENILGGFQVKLCGFIQYFNLVGSAIGYTIATAISMIALERSNCFHEKGHDNPCRVSGTPYMLMFGIVEILLSQIPDFDQITWLSMASAVMSFTYSSIGLGLGISKVVAARYFPESKFINSNIEIPIPFGGYKPYKLNMFRLVWRTAFVCMTTIVAMLMPFFNDVVGILGAVGFWPLTVYFPVKMYIVQKKIPKWSTRWILLQILSIACLIISLFALAGSFAGVVTDLKVYKPFKTMY